MQARDRRRLAHRRLELGADVVDLERRQAQTCPWTAPASRTSPPASTDLAIAVAAEVDAGQNDLAVALGDAPPTSASTACARRLGSRRGRAARRRSCSRSCTVLDLHERTDAVETHLVVDAADRADVAGDERGRLLRAPGDDDDVGRHVRERVREVRAATGDVDAAVRASRARDFLPRLGDGLVGHAARVHDRDLGAARELAMAVGDQALPHGLGVGVRDLAAEEAHVERGHVQDRTDYRRRSGPQPSRRAPGSRRAPSPRLRLFSRQVARGDELGRRTVRRWTRRRRARCSRPPRPRPGARPTRRPRLARPRRRRSARRWFGLSRRRADRRRPRARARSRACARRPRERRSRSRRRGARPGRSAGARDTAASSRARPCRTRGPGR